MSMPSNEDDTIAAARAQVREDAQPLIEFVQRLVRIPSVNPKFQRDPALNREAEVQDAIEAELRALGFAAERTLPLPERPNLRGRWPGSDRRSLALCGHVDVVPHGDASQWSGDPFSGEIRGERLYGRGAADMKAGLAAMLFACRALHRLGVRLEGRLEFHSLVDEEAGGFGAKAMSAASAGLEAVMFAEPSGEIIRPWAGGLDWVRVIVRGRNGHSARRFASIYPSSHSDQVPVRSVNAIELGARVLGCIRELETHWAVSKSFAGLPPGINTISPGVMVAGCGENAAGVPTLLANPAMVPDVCTIDFDLKFLPFERTADVRAEFEAWIERFAACDPWLRDHPPEVRWELAELHFPPVNTAADHAVVRALSDGVRGGGQSVELAGTFGVSDAAHYSPHGMACVVYGPKGASIHGPDEYVEIPSVIRVAQAMAEAIVRYCGVREAGVTPQDAGCSATSVPSR